MGVCARLVDFPAANCTEDALVRDPNVTRCVAHPAATPRRRINRPDIYRRHLPISIHSAYSFTSWKSSAGTDNQWVTFGNTRHAGCQRAAGISQRRWFAAG